MSKQMIVNTAEALKLINRRTGLKHIGYAVFIRPLLPTDGNQGFPGAALVNVKKADFIAALKHTLEHFEKRGGKIELTVPTEDFESFVIG